MVLKLVYMSLLPSKQRSVFTKGKGEKTTPNPEMTEKRVRKVTGMRLKHLLLVDTMEFLRSSVNSLKTIPPPSYLCKFSSNIFLNYQVIMKVIKIIKKIEEIYHAIVYLLESTW